MVDFDKRNRERREGDRPRGESQLEVKPLPRDERTNAEPTRDAPTRDMLSEDQVEVFDALVAWLSKKDRSGDYVTLGGLAGTGKTTLIAALAHQLQQAGGRRVIFTAFTGKAVDVLGRKLRSYGVWAPCVTLHALLYIPQDDGKGGITWISRPGIDADLVIVDEASMVDSELWEELRRHRKPIIAVGDHGQLPPVGNDKSLMLMAKPHFRLEKIHRQAEGNPIIALAHFVRDGNHPRKFRAADDRVSFIKSFDVGAPIVAAGGFDCAAICYFNKTRVRFNELVRKARGYQGPDIVICLKNTEKILYNGMRGLLYELDYANPDAFGCARATYAFPDHGILVKCRTQLAQFGAERTIGHPDDIGASTWRDLGMLFDFGYTLTCHKAQGSQWSTVVVKYEVLRKDTEDTRRRWLYTAVTRASDKLYLIT